MTEQEVADELALVIERSTASAFGPTDSRSVPRKQVLVTWAGGHSTVTGQRLTAPPGVRASAEKRKQFHRQRVLTALERVS
jgi:hypothetical protein